MRRLSAVGVKARTSPVVAATLPVTSCGDASGAGSGSLRSIVAAAGEGDTVDLTGLTCSVITLKHGAIPVSLDNLTIIGAGADKLAIDGSGSDRVFVHYGSGTLRLSGLTVRNGANVLSGFNVAAGGCIASNGYLTLDHSVVSGCLASGEGAYGGGIIARGLTLYTSTLSGNVALGSHPATFTAAYGGGAFAYHGAATLYDSTVTGNRAAHTLSDTNGSYCTGGGIFADDGGSATRSTIEGNYSYGTGGGVASHAGFSVTGATISGNVAQNKNGGGIFVRFFDTMSVSNSTIAYNRAVAGGGIYVSGMPAGFVLQSTIVAGNAASGGAAEIGSQAVLEISGANNLVMLTDAAATLPADTLHADPKLLPLADNGGPTLTHALAPDSPAVDSGNNVAGLATDQRGSGFARVSGTAADIGAFEADRDSIFSDGFD